MITDDQLTIAAQAVAIAEAVLERALLQGDAPLDELSELIKAARVLLEWAGCEHARGWLSADEAAMVRYHAVEMQQHVTKRCLQLPGGFDSACEPGIDRTNELMKVIISRSLGLDQRELSLPSDT